MDFSGYKLIAISIVFFELVILCLCYRKNPRLAVVVTLISIVLKGQYLWVGNPIYAWQLSALLGLSFLLSRQSGERFVSAGKTLNYARASMHMYFFYALIISVPMWSVFGAEGLGTSTTGVSISRVTTQTAYLLLLLGLYGFGIWAAKYITTFNLIGALIYIASVVAYFGILQALLMAGFGLNIFPIIGSDDTVRSAYILDTTFRVTSFAGEPKHLGLLMSTGLVMVFLARLFRLPIGGRFAFHLPLVMTTALLLSLSTTGLVITVTTLAIAGLLFFRRLRRVDLIVVGLLVAALLLQWAYFSEDFRLSLDQQISRNEFEVQDQSVMQALVANSSLFFLGSGLGNIHLFAVDYLPAGFPLFRDHGYKANSGLFFILGDSGLIGLLLLIFGPLFALKAYFGERRRFSSQQREEAIAASAVIFISLLSFLMRYDVSYFLCSGFVFSRLANLRREAIRNNFAVGARIESSGRGARNTA